MLKWINKKRNQKGFTLIELVVVIAILGILAALAIPRLSGFSDTAVQRTLLADIKTIESAAIAVVTNDDTLEFTSLEFNDTNFGDFLDNDIITKYTATGVEISFDNEGRVNDFSINISGQDYDYTALTRTVAKGES